jgi:lipopolysaccharide heptosyltransferase II
MRWNECKKILCVRLDNVGDLLMTTPAIRALKETVPERELTLLGSSKIADAASLIPYIDDTIIYDAPWVKATPKREDPDGDLAIIEELHQRNFDAAIIFTVFSQNPLPAAMLCYLAGIPLRAAYCHENPYQLLTDWIKDPDPQDGIRHEVQRQLDLAAEIGSRTSNSQLILNIPRAAKEAVVSLIEEKGISLSAPFVVVHPGASAPSRRYPADKFAQAASSLRKELGCQLIFTGSPEEEILVEGIRDDMDAPSESLAGTLDFAQFAALIALASVVVTNNTAPAHIASAVGTPVVDLYALTNPQHTPWQVRNRVLSYDVPCKYCFKSVCPQGHHQCLDLVPSQEIVKAVQELLQEEHLISSDLQQRI